MGFFVTQSIGIVIWWWEFRGGMRDHYRAGNGAAKGIGGPKLAGAGGTAWVDPSGLDHP